MSSTLKVLRSAPCPRVCTRATQGPAETWELRKARADGLAGEADARAGRTDAFSESWKVAQAVSIAFMSSSSWLAPSTSLEVRATPA